MNNNNNQNLTSARTGGKAFTMLMCIYLLTSLVLQSILGLVFKTDSIWFLFFSGITPAIAITLILCLYNRGNFSQFKSDFMLNGTKAKYWIVILPLFLGMFFGLGFINGLIGEGIQALGGTLPQLKLPLTSVWEYLLMCLSYAVFPAVFEELFFRGLLLNSLKNTGETCAILSTALCFALYHCSLIQFVYQFIYGLILATIVYKTKSIIPSMALHFLNNFTVLSLEFFGVSVNLYYIWYIIFGLVILAVGIAFLVLPKGKRNQNKSVQEKGAKTKDFWFPFALFGAIVCAGMAILGVVAI